MKKTQAQDANVQKRPKVISFILLKGGCGKTTTAINTANAFAEMGNRVLLIDIDPQASATKILGELENSIDYKPALAELFSGEAQAGDLFYGSRVKNLALVPNNIRIYPAINGITTLDEMFGAMDIFTAFTSFWGNFDYVIIDCPPQGDGVLSNCALSLSDYAISPIDGAFALDAIPKMKGMIGTAQKRYNPRVSQLGYVLNKTKVKTLNTDYLSESLAQLVGEEAIFKTTIPEKEIVKQSQSIRNTVFGMAKNDMQAVYLKFAKEIKMRIKADEKARGGE